MRTETLLSGEVEKKKTESLTFRVRPQLKSDLEKAAAAANRSVSEQIEYTLLRAGEWERALGDLNIIERRIESLQQFCLGWSAAEHGPPQWVNQAKPFYLLFRHAGGIIGEVTDIEDAMHKARAHVQKNPCEYVVMKAVAVVRPSAQMEEILLSD